MKVRIPSPLRSYTHNKSEVEATGACVADVLVQLDSAYPGIRFRMIDEQDAIRTHIKIFVNNDLATRLTHKVKDEDTVHIICALSGG